MATEEVDATRTTVKTYVPAYQRAAWDGHADDLDMSRSEFVRSMVQAGRRGFGDEEAAAPDSAGPDSDTPPEAVETAESAVGDGDDQRPFETRILNALSKSEYLSWDELVETVTSDIEGQLETTVQDLQADNLVRYSGPNGGYTIDE